LHRFLTCCRNASPSSAIDVSDSFITSLLRLPQGVYHSSPFDLRSPFFCDLLFLSHLLTLLTIPLRFRTREGFLGCRWAAVCRAPASRPRRLRLVPQQHSKPSFISHSHALARSGARRREKTILYVLLEQPFYCYNYSTATTLHNDTNKTI